MCPSREIYRQKSILIKGTTILHTIFNEKKISLFIGYYCCAKIEKDREKKNIVDSLDFWLVQCKCK